MLAPNGVDTERFGPANATARAAARKAMELDGDTFTALFVGCLVQRKGVDVLLQAWARTATARHGRLLLTYHGVLLPAAASAAAGGAAGGGGGR